MKEYIREYRKLLKFARSFRWMLVLAMLVMGVSTLFDGVTLTMLLPLLDRILSNTKIVVPMELPVFLSAIIDKLNSMSQADILKSLMTFVVVLFLLKEIALYVQNYLMNAIGQGVVREVRNRIYAKLQTLSLGFYASRRTGELISRITNDVNYITNAISYGLADLIYQSMQAVLYAIMAFVLGFAISWKFAFVVFFIFPSIMFPVIRIGKRIKKFSIEVQNKMADLNSLLTETIAGAYIVKVFNREDYENKRFSLINANYYKYMLKTIKRTLILAPLTELIGALGVVLILLIAGKQVISGKISGGAFVLFLGSLMSMIRPIKKLSNVFAINQQAFAASHRIYDILEVEPKIKDTAKSSPLKEFKDHIQFEGVFFKYDEGEDVLKDIHLTVNKGEVLALVGHSGAGKSTLVGLLPRLYDPYKGKILLDGHELKDIKLQDLRSLISVVSQEMVLFNTSVRDNISYGNPKASEEEIIEAAKKAYAFDFIMKMPKGFSTLIGDRGVRLSGGERQRLAIARAILKNAPVLILDEATSQLDSRSEQLIKEAVYNLIQDKTAFIIAHRLSTVEKASRIVLLENGKIMEEGTHSYLVSRDSLYKKLYESQFSSRDS